MKTVLTQFFKPIAAVGLAATISACSTTGQHQPQYQTFVDQESGITTVVNQDTGEFTQNFNEDIAAARLKEIEYTVEQTKESQLQLTRDTLVAEQNGLREVLRLEEQRVDNSARLYNVATISRLMQVQIDQVKDGIENNRPYNEYEAGILAILSFSEQSDEIKVAIEASFGMSLQQLKDSYGPIEERPGKIFHPYRGAPEYSQFKQDRCVQMATPGIQALAFVYNGSTVAALVDEVAIPYGPCVNDEVQVPYAPEEPSQP